MKSLGSFMGRAEGAQRWAIGRRGTKPFNAGRAIQAILLLLVLIFTLIAGIYWYRGVHSARDIQAQHFPIHHHANLAITNDRGNVRIHNGPSGMVEVKSTRYELGVIPDVQNLLVDEHAVGNGDTIVINTLARVNPANVKAYGIDLDVTIPRVADFTVSVQSGNISIDGVNGTVQAKTNSGSINAQNIKGTGEIVLQASDAIDVDRLSGFANFSTRDGHIEAVETTLYGRSSMTSTNGDIAFDGNIETDCHCLFSSKSGSIDITLPSLTSFDLHTSTVHGLVENEFAGDQTGVAPRATIDIQTVNGDITINDPNS